MQPDTPKTSRGILSEYLNKKLAAGQINNLRREQLKRIAQIRKRTVMAYASAYSKPGPVYIDYDDRLPFFDLLNTLPGDALDLIVETPGGSAEVVQDLVRATRGRFRSVGMIVPGQAKSAGTILVMAGDEILMDPTSALGPIDAQMVQGAKRFSAQAFLDGLEKIKQEVEKAGRLNRAYIPILQNVSPGEIQNCQNMLDFGKTLVADWLREYKFKDWATHSSTGQPVTPDDKVRRAREVADALCDHARWLSHGRSITMKDLQDMRLQITDYTSNPGLCDAIRRYYVLLRMTFDHRPDVIKVIETPDAHIVRHAASPVALPKGMAPRRPAVDHVIVEVECPKCKTKSRVQANLVQGVSLEPGALLFPKDNVWMCPQCKNPGNLTPIREALQSQLQRPIL